MKKMLLIFSLLIVVMILIIINQPAPSPSLDPVLLDLGYTKKDSQNYDTTIIDTIKEHMIPKTFFQAISHYNSFQEKNLSKYYSYYLKGYTIIQSLNFINYPNFLIAKVDDVPAISPSNILLVNQTYNLSADFIPKNLVPLTGIAQIKRPNETMTIKREVYLAYQELLKEMEGYDLDVIVYSAYRTYQKQVELWTNAAYPDNYLARPGHSEHQSGLAIDIATTKSGLTTSFDDTNAYQFLKHHAFEAGFIIRYPPGKETITGYAYEPWHFRYVGIEVATVIYQENLTLEEYIYNYEVIPLA